MKKTVRLVLFLLMAMFIISGCAMRSLYNVSVTSDKKATLEIVMAYDNATIDGMINFQESAGQEGTSGEVKTYTDAERWAFLESDYEQEGYEEYTRERYEDGEWKGFKVILKDDLDNMVYTETGEEKKLDDLTKEGKLFKKNGNEYSIEVGSEPNDNVEAAQEMSDEEGVFDFKFTISLPAPAKSNNATTISEDKLTYTWDLLKTSQVKLVFEIPEEAKTPEVKPTEKPADKTLPTWSSASTWALDELAKANERGLIPETFDKKDYTKSIDRKDFAAVAVKLYEAITNTVTEKVTENPFTDTTDDYVLKAFKLGITQGTSANTFSPDSQITREQMATMLTRALDKAGIATKVNLDEVTTFADDVDMSNWARESVYFMSHNEIIKGIGDNKFGAKNNSTLEQSILIASRSVDTFKK